MSRIVTVALFSIVAAAQNLPVPASGGRIQGRVVDVVDAEISAFVRVIRTETGDVVDRMHTDRTGAFLAEALTIGTYTLTAAVGGFRRADLTGIIVRDSETTDLGRIRLGISSCDAPGVFCDYFGPRDNIGPWTKAVVGTGPLQMKLLCGVDIDDKSKMYCPDSPSQEIDMQFRKDGPGLFLATANGAAFPNFSNGDAATQSSPRSAFA